MNRLRAGAQVGILHTGTNLKFSEAVKKLPSPEVKPSSGMKQITWTKSADTRDMAPPIELALTPNQLRDGLWAGGPAYITA